MEGEGRSGGEERDGGGRSVMFHDTSSWGGFSWHTADPTCLHKSVAVFREEHASKKKRAIDWDETRFLADGIFLKWHAKAQFKNAYDWFARVLYGKLTDSEWHAWVVRGHRDGFDPDVAAKGAAPRREVVWASAQDSSATSAPAATGQGTSEASGESLSGPLAAEVASSAAPAPAGTEPAADSPGKWCSCAVLQATEDLETLQKLGKLYSLHEEVASGSFGTVARLDRGGIAAVGKQIFRRGRQATAILPEVMREAAVLGQCRGVATITQLWDLVVWQGRFMLVFEAWGRGLSEHFRLSPGDRRPEVLRKIVADVLAGLSFLHSELGLLHADLKPNNVLVREALAPAVLPAARISDLGSVVQATPLDPPIPTNRRQRAGKGEIGWEREQRHIHAPHTNHRFFPPQQQRNTSARPPLHRHLPVRPSPPHPHPRLAVAIFPQAIAASPRTGSSSPSAFAPRPHAFPGCACAASGHVCGGRLLCSNKPGAAGAISGHGPRP